MVLTNSIQSMVRRAPLVSFVALTFALCWGIGAILDGVPIIAPDGSFVGGTLIAALAITALAEGRLGLQELGRRLVRWRVGVQWYGVVFALPVVIVGATMTLLRVVGGVSLDWAARPALAQMTGLLLFFVIFPIGAPFAEEVAWRGFALPRLLHRRSPATASLILGTIWSTWHIPVVVSDPTLRVPFPFLSAVLSLSILSTWLFLRTGGSVLIAVLFHSWYDVVLMFVAQMVATGNYALLWWMLFAVQTVVAIAVAFLLQSTDRSKT